MIYDEMPKQIIFHPLPSKLGGIKLRVIKYEGLTRALNLLEWISKLNRLV
jgi:hypothetical protein